MNLENYRVPNTKYISLVDFEKNLKSFSKSMKYHLRFNRTYFNILFPEVKYKEKYKILDDSEVKYKFLWDYLNFYKQDPISWSHDVPHVDDKENYIPPIEFLYVSGNITKQQFLEQKEKFYWWDEHPHLISPEINIEEFRSTIEHLEKYFNRYSKIQKIEIQEVVEYSVVKPTKLRELNEDSFLEFQNSLLKWCENSSYIFPSINLPQMCYNLQYYCNRRDVKFPIVLTRYLHSIANNIKFETPSPEKENFEDHQLVMQEYLKNQIAYDSGEKDFSKVKFSSVSINNHE